MKIKTIDVNAKEWFDKANGNSYFAGEVTINYGMKSESTVDMPFQYGYGNYFEQAALEELKSTLDATDAIQDVNTLWRYCQENNIILRSNKQENCLKKDLINY